MDIKGSKDLHDIEVKVRLRKSDYKRLLHLAAAADDKTAVAARKLLKTGMDVVFAHYFGSDLTERTTAN